MKKFFNLYEEMFLTLAFLWFLIGILPFLLGLYQGSQAPVFSNCKDDWERIEYAFPQYRLGCWLGSSPE